MVLSRSFLRSLATSSMSVVTFVMGLADGGGLSVKMGWMSRGDAMWARGEQVPSVVFRRTIVGGSVSAKYTRRCEGGRVWSKPVVPRIGIAGAVALRMGVVGESRMGFGGDRSFSRGLGLDANGEVACAPAFCCSVVAGMNHRMQSARTLMPKPTELYAFAEMIRNTDRGFVGSAVVPLARAGRNCDMVFRGFRALKIGIVCQPSVASHTRSRWIRV